MKFRYRLEGWESEWHDADTRRTAFYTQLGPGTYGFRVVASNNDGVWNEIGATLPFTVAPAWFQTLWFKALVALAIGVMLLLLYRIRVRQVSAALAARFDARLAERTRIARDLHDTLLQTVQVSKMTADDALDAAPDPERMRRVVQQLSEWLGQAVSEGRAALNSLRTSTVEVNDLADAFRRAATSTIKPETLAVSVNVGGQSRDLHPIVRDEIYRIGYEAIRNACAHSGGTRLNIRLEYTSDLTLVVADDGIGIDPIVSRQGEGRTLRPSRHARTRGGRRRDVDGRQLWSGHVHHARRARACRVPKRARNRPAARAVNDHKLMMPRRTPMVTAEVRSFTPSFSMMCLRCTFTVSSEMSSCSAIWRLRFPKATCCNTSISRSVSSSSPMCSASLTATSDGTRFWPAWTCRIDLDKIFRRHALQHIATRPGR